MHDASHRSLFRSRGVNDHVGQWLCAYPIWSDMQLYRPLPWVRAWLTTYTLVTRIRSIAEHALTQDAGDPLGNTRTTLASLWERLFITPNRVNYPSSMIC